MQTGPGGGGTRTLLDEVELFPFGPHDDAVDAASLALAEAAVELGKLGDRLGKLADRL